MTEYDAPANNSLQRDRLAEPVREEPSIAQLLSNLVADAQTLFRKELDLARTEVTTELNKARDGAIALGIGAGILAIGGLLLILMVVHVLIDVAGLAPWVAYLIVGGLLTIIGGIALYMGLQRVRQIDPVPHETIDSVRKDVEWLKEQSPSDRT